MTTTQHCACRGSVGGECLANEELLLHAGLLAPRDPCICQAECSLPGLQRTPPSTTGWNSTAGGSGLSVTCVQLAVDVVVSGNVKQLQVLLSHTEIV